MLHEVAVAASPGWIGFHVGDPVEWYGQAIAEVPAGELPAGESNRRSRLVGRRAAPRAIMPVQAITLTSILDDLERVDFVDADIQGAEADVMEQAADDLDRKVKRVHIGTHSTEGEERLRALFGSLAWECVWDFPCLTASETPWGRVSFEDGIQTWLNPKLAAAAEIRSSG